MKYFVIARKWEEEKQSVQTYIAGSFPDWVNANIFCKAYDEHYKAGALIVSEDDLVNK